MRLETEQIVYRDGDARLNGFLAIDADRSGKRPGVLVVHGGATFGTTARRWFAACSRRSRSCHRDRKSTAASPRSAIVSVA